MQAGSSPDGRAFAARWAEAIFTAHQTLENAQEFYSDIKARARAAGRDPGQLKVLPGISPFIGSTTAEARALEEEFNDLTQPAYSSSPPRSGGKRGATTATRGVRPVTTPTLRSAPGSPGRAPGAPR